MRWIVSLVADVSATRRVTVVHVSRREAGLVAHRHA